MSHLLRNLFTCLFIGLLLLAAPLSHAHAAASDWQGDDNVRVRLVSGTDGIADDAHVSLGLDVELAEGWHTYWRTPGMAGLPPQLDWRASQNDDSNLKDATLLFPAPKRYTAYGLETIGYRGHVLFPIDVLVRNAGHALTLNPTVNLLVCSSVCVPKTFTLTLTIPAGSAAASNEADLIQQFRDHIPGDGAQSGLLIKKIINDGEGITVSISSRHSLTEPDIFIEPDSEVTFKAPVVSLGNHGLSADLRIVPADALPEGTTLAGKMFTLTIVEGDNALERHITIPAVGAEPPSTLPPPASLMTILLLAILGGFILNLMPCVLPVLSLKLLSVVSHGGGSTRAVRRSFLTTAAGIIFSFLVLGGITTALRTLGHSFGWGVQFQQPAFLLFLIILLTFFTASMWDILHINLPRFLADGVNDASYHPKLAGDFATGAFATLLATPCSAPFLGTAIGFALTSPPAIIIAVFFALGFGMALPYLLITLRPGIATALPKPGHWMISLRRLLGLALALTGIWLLWVLSAQISAQFAALCGLCLTAVILVMAIGQRLLPRWATWAAVLILLLGTIGLTVAGSRLPKTNAVVDQLWHSFSEQSLAANNAEGKTVFLDITADWCITCKANKHFILSDEKLRERLFHTDIVAMQADWTNPDPVIADFLHKYGRYGIPFNAVFGPGAPDGIILPELLTPALVNDALDKASKSVR